VGSSHSRPLSRCCRCNSSLSCAPVPPTLTVRLFGISTLEVTSSWRTTLPLCAPCLRAHAFCSPLVLLEKIALPLGPVKTGWGLLREKRLNYEIQKKKFCHP
jgi:hypothetical protein